MGLDIVQSFLAVQGASPTAPSFDVACILAFKVPAGFPASGTVTYSGSSGLADMVTDGFTVTDPAYLCATAFLSQSPCPEKFKVARRSAGTQQVIQLLVTSSTAGDKYAITCNGTSVTYTVPAAQTTTLVAASLAALITPAITGTAAASTSIITVSRGAAGLNDFESWSSNLELTDASSDPGVVADYTAAKTADPNFYAVLLDSNSKAEVVALAAAVEADKRRFFSNSSDTGAYNPGVSSDTGSVLRNASYKYSHQIFSKNKVLSYRAAALCSVCLVRRPGTYTAAFKALAGQSVDLLTKAQSDALLAKNYTVYVREKGLPITYEGKTASGSYIDLEIFRDYLAPKISTDVFALYTNNDRVSFDQTGIDLHTATVEASLQNEEGLKLGIVPGSIVVNKIKASSVSASDKSLRVLKNITWSAVYETPIHRSIINGVLTL